MAKVAKSSKPTGDEGPLFNSEIMGSPRDRITGRSITKVEKSSKPEAKSMGGWEMLSLKNNQIL